MKRYRTIQAPKTGMSGVETYEGETIEKKVARIMENNEPIKDGAPEIYTERKDGIVKAYNIRTDRWEVAADAMDAVNKSFQAKREEKAKLNEEPEKGKVIPLDGNETKDGGAEPIQG